MGREPAYAVYRAGFELETIRDGTQQASASTYGLYYPNLAKTTTHSEGFLTTSTETRQVSSGTAATATSSHESVQTTTCKAEYALYEEPVDPQHAIQRQLRQLKHCARRSEYRTRQLTRDIVISKELLKKIQIQNEQARMIERIRVMERIKRVQLRRLKEATKTRLRFLKRHALIKKATDYDKQVAELHRQLIVERALVKLRLCLQSN